MELALGADQEFFRDTTRKFLETEMPLSEVRGLEGDPLGFRREWWQRGARLGWTGLLVPEQYGGGSLTGSGLLDLVLVAEQMGMLVSPGPLVPVSVVADTIARSGSDEQRRRYLEPVVTGALIPTWAYAEPGAGIDAREFSVRAEIGDRSVVLDGTKTLVEAGGAADVLLVTATAGSGVAQVLVPCPSPGVSVTPLTSVDLTRRYVDVAFDRAELGADAIVGDPATSFRDVERQFQIAAVLHAAECSGVLTRVFEMTLQYLDDRYSFGRPLSSYQALKHRMADNKLAVECSLAVATAAARSVQSEAPEAVELTSAAKAYTGEAATDVIHDCIQLHGGIGVTWEHDLHLYLRRALVDRMTYGTPDDHRERIAATLMPEDAS